MFVRLCSSTWPLLLLGLSPLIEAQGLDPAQPNKEYIRLNGQIVAIENAPPSGSPTAAVETRKERSATTEADHPFSSVPFLLPGRTVVRYVLPLPEAAGSSSAPPR